MHRKKFKDFIKYTGLFCVAIVYNFIPGTAFADNAPLAILGGQGSAPYAAFLHSDGSIAELNGLPHTGLTYRVAINSSKQSIIGGTEGLNAYAALVSPEGVVKSIPDLIAPGEIYTVAINKSGRSLIGGGHLNSNTPYAALISKKGFATPLNLPSSGLIYSVALKKSGEGIVGGIGPLNSAYAGIISPKGNVTPISGLPTAGAIYWVSANKSNLKFIGGQKNDSIYATFVNPDGSLKEINDLPSGLNYSVALNNSGNAIMGGTSLTLPYAAIVNSEGSVTTLKGLPNTEGKIYTVAINESGTGLIAGFSTTGPYGSLVDPKGKLTPLVGLPTGDGFLDGVALHESGVGIVGGTSSNTPFAALVAPNGSLIYLNGLPSTGEINSISIAELDNLVPKSLGTLDSLANTQFALGDALTQHLLVEKTDRSSMCSGQQITGTHYDTGLHSIWLSAYGNYVHEKANHSLPTFTNEIAGIICGLDYKGIEEVVIGGALAYSNNSIHYFHEKGKGHINQESAVIYATWDGEGFYINGALWAGLFQTRIKRHSLFSMTSTAKPSGWNLSPQLEMGAPVQVSIPMNIVVDPFIAFNWANNWQRHFREKGDSGFNLKLKNHCASLFRSELGIRFFETLQYCWGDVILQEKISYVNRTVVGNKRNAASFVGSASSFDVITLNYNSQNHGNVQMHIECVPAKLYNLSFFLDYQGEFGTRFQAHLLTFSLEKSF